MGMFPDDDDSEEIDDQFAENVLRKANEGHAYVDVDDIYDAYHWLLARDRADDAAAVLNYGLELHVGNSKFLLLRAMTLIDKNELAKAEMLLDYVADNAQDEPTYHISRGWLALKKDKENEAKSSFDEAVKVAEEEERDSIIGEIGSNLVRLEKFQMAVKYLDLLPSDYYKGNIPSAFEFAYALSLSGREGQAMELYEQITADDPFYDEAWYNLGIIYGQKGLYDKALEAYTNCVDVNPYYAEAFFNLGNTYLVLENVVKAVECYTEYLSLSQPDPEMRVYTYLGDCWLQLGNFDLAMRILAFVVERTPANDSAWYDLGRCYLEMGRNTKAIHAFHKAIGICAEASSYHFGLAQGYVNTGHKDKAIAAIEAGLHCSPDDVLAWFELIRMTFDFSNCDVEEFDSYMSAKKEEFNSPEALLLVEAYVEFFVFKKKRVATTLLRKVAKCMPKVIMDASEEPSLSQLFEQKGIVKVLNEFNIKLK